jgi:4-aminobutyrate aminotransferase
MVGIELASPSAPSTDLALNKNAPQRMASRIAAKCLEKGMLLLTTSVFEVIRFIPPLNISEADMAKGCEIFKEAFWEVVHEG